MLIVHTVMEESEDIPDFDIMQHPFNLTRRASWRMLDEAERCGREAIEILTWHDVRTLSQVVTVRSVGLEKWE